MSIRGIKADEALEGKGLTIGIVASRWNATVIDALVGGCKERLAALNVTVLIERVSGAYEIPLASDFMLSSGRFDAIVAIGCLVKGETMHFEYICDAVTHGIMKLNLEHKKPVIYGILNVLTEDQAKGRAGLLPDTSNAGIEWANAAVESCMLARKYALYQAMQKDKYAVSR